MKIIYQTKKASCLVLLLFTVTCGALAQSFQKTPSGIKTIVDSMEVDIQYYNPATVRVLKSPLGWKYSKESLSVVETPQAVKLNTTQQGDVVKLQSNSVSVELNLTTGEVLFSDPQGAVLLSEKGQPSFLYFDDSGVDAFRVKQTFLLEEDESIYGLGILQNGKMSQRNQTKHLVQGNVEDVTPFIQSIKIGRASCRERVYVLG